MNGRPSRLSEGGAGETRSHTQNAEYMLHVKTYCTCRLTYLDRKTVVHAANGTIKAASRNDCRLSSFRKGNGGGWEIRELFLSFFFSKFYLLPLVAPVQSGKRFVNVNPWPSSASESTTERSRKDLARPFLITITSEEKRDREAERQRDRKSLAVCLEGASRGER